LEASETSEGGKQTELANWFEEFSQNRMNLSGDTPNKRNKGRTTNKKDDLVSYADGIQNWYFVLRVLAFVNFRLPDRPLGDSV